MEAITREEKIISGENLTPITRKEMFLAKASGQNIQTPTPITREEYFLSKITGGGSTPVEGTAIPVGEKVEKIYFNTNLSIEETNAYLSQLTYVDVGLVCPVSILYAQTDNGVEGMFIVAFKTNVGYVISILNNVNGNIFEDLYYGADINRNGWNGMAFSSSSIGAIYMPYGFVAIDCDLSVITDIEGILPVGAENEKIKNVLSITPFGGCTSSNKPTAYTVSSVDELPSDAVDGSTAIVPSDSIIGKYKWKETLTFEALNLPTNYDSFENGETSLDVACYFIDEMAGLCELFKFYKEDGAICLYLGETYAYNEIYGWDDSFIDIKILGEPYPVPNVAFAIAKENFIAWFKQNTEKLSGGYSLYTNENGQWVYKCEVA